MNCHGSTQALALFDATITRRCVSAELAPQGIWVNLVCPGFIDKPMHYRGRGMVGDDLYGNATHFLGRFSLTPASGRTQWPRDPPEQFADKSEANYSQRNATMGSTLVARRAGM